MVEQAAQELDEDEVIVVDAGFSLEHLFTLTKARFKNINSFSKFYGINAAVGIAVEVKSVEESDTPRNHIIE